MLIHRQSVLLWIWPGIAVCVLGLLAACVREAGDPSESISRDLHFRAVWVQDAGEEYDPFCRGNGLRLMGYDSRKGRERVLSGTVTNYHKPIFTPSGRRVVYSDYQRQQMFIIDWQGRGVQALGAGIAVDVWREPESGRSWVYAVEEKLSEGRSRWARLVRFPLDAPAEREEVWDETPVSADNMQVSRDGTHIGGLLPWPHGGTIILPENRWQKLGRGCWASLAPDDSYLFWVFDGPHRNIYINSVQDFTKRKVAINGAPGIDGFEVYHPRWSNHPRYFAMTGPYKEGGGGNRISAGGPEVEVYLGRFSAECDRVEAWRQITRNEAGDYSPDVWIEGDEATHGDGQEVASAAPRAVPIAATLQSTRWPATQDGLVFVWETGRAQNEIAVPDGTTVGCRLFARGRAHYGAFHDLVLHKGAFLAEDADARLLARCREHDALTLEAVITPLGAAQSGPARILSFSRDASHRNFTLGQEGEWLILRLRTPQTGANGVRPQVKLCKLRNGVAQHVIVSYRPGKLAVYVDGARVLASREIKGDFSNWSPQTLIFGDEVTGGRSWTGRLEGVAIYSRRMGAEEAAENFRLYQDRVKDRRMPERFEVRGTLRETIPSPDPDRMGDYRRALGLFVYAVGGVPGGEKGDEILVAHWLVMDRQRIERPSAIGSVHDLVLERWEDHPQLDSELRVEGDRIDLPVFVDVSLTGSGREP